MKEYTIKALALPANVNALTTGSYVDMSGVVEFGGRSAKFVLLAGAGTTAGTCGGYVQTAQDTSGTGLETLVTFDGLTASGGTEEQHVTIPVGHRYARFVATVQSGKDMNVSAFVVAQKRVA